MKKIIIWFTVCVVAVLVVACRNDDEPPVYEEDTIENPVTSITLSVGPEGIILPDVSSTATVAVSAVPSNAGNIDRVDYVFISGNTSVFTVDNAGNITATGPGETILSVLVNNYANIKAVCKVTVVGKRITSVTINEDYKERLLSVGVGVTAVQSYELGPQITIAPDDASVKMLKFSSSNQDVAYVNGDGQVVGKAFGFATIRVEAMDGSGKFDESIVKVGEWKSYFIDRSSWQIVSSPWIKFKPNGTDDEYGGPPENLIDDNSEDTRVGLLKASAAGGPADGLLYFAIDMGSEQNFNNFYWEGGWTNGSGSVNNNTKINRILFLYGSNQSITGPWTELQTNINISGNVYSSTINLSATHNYRYVKAVVRPSNTGTADNAIAVLWRDFKLGYRYIQEP